MHTNETPSFSSYWPLLRKDVKFTSAIRRKTTIHTHERDPFLRSLPISSELARNGPDVAAGRSLIAVVPFVVDVHETRGRKERVVAFASRPSTLNESSTMKWGKTRGEMSSRKLGKQQAYWHTIKNVKKKTNIVEGTHCSDRTAWTTKNRKKQHLVYRTHKLVEIVNHVKLNTFRGFHRKRGGERREEQG